MLADYHVTQNIAMIRFIPWNRLSGTRGLRHAYWFRGFLALENRIENMEIGVGKFRAIW